MAELSKALKLSGIFKHRNLPKAPSASMMWAAISVLSQIAEASEGGGNSFSGDSDSSNDWIIFGSIIGGVSFIILGIAFCKCWIDGRCPTTVTAKEFGSKVSPF